MKEKLLSDRVDFVFRNLPYDLSSRGGLALVGRLIKRINLAALIDQKYPVQAERRGHRQSIARPASRSPP
ncbi:MAG: hypothetical protein AB7S86_00720 [Hydrogenophaga sp.]|uniref:hypothetical protein n=1 Tax=Hydrogenophaga sp. TaxID=1904254 RepID=UPI003D10C5E0